MANPATHTITLQLNEEEQALVDALAHEQGLSTQEEALHALIRDAVAVYDALWDKAFAESQEMLDKLADEAHAEYVAGRTEDFDPDNDADVL